MTSKLHRLNCALRDVFSISPPMTRAAVQATPIDHAHLRAIYANLPVSEQADDVVLYRIIGNDLPPRHQHGQSLRNLEFIIQHEPEFPNCQKRFIINRMVETDTEKRIVDLLESEGFGYHKLSFDPDAYRTIPLDYACLPGEDKSYLSSRAFQRQSSRHKIRLLTAVNRLRNNYVMHNNGARNRALEQGCSEAKWVLPFDGNCFFTASAFEQLYQAIVEQPWLKHFVVPMARIHDNQELLNDSFLPRADEEPQLVFRCDAKARFNEAFPYGRFPKIEMFWHLGIPGNWSYTVEKAWDPARRTLSPEAYQFGLAGWVARLYSGVAHLEASGHRMGSQRGDARRAAILDILARLDREHLGGCEFERFLPSE